MRKTTGFLAGLLLVSGACGPTTRFVHPEADLPFYEKVAVIPFTSLAQDRLAGDKVTNVFFTEVLRRRYDQVVEPGQFMAAMTRVRGGTPFSNPWSSEELAKLAEDLGVQGFFLGTVREYSMVPNGRDMNPLVALEVRFVDAATGRLVWSASESRKSGMSVPIVGHAARTLDGLTSEVCHDLLRTLPEGKRHAKRGS